MNATHEMPAPGTKEKVPFAKCTLLLADDDPAIRRVLQRLLELQGYRVLTAADGAQALEIASATTVNLALLDLNMPVLDGWDTFEKLSAQHPLLPVVLITARANQFFLAQAAGVGALLEKPLDFEKLFHTIRNLLAEPAEACLARYAGRAAMFRYAHPKTELPAHTGAAGWGRN